MKLIIPFFFYFLAIYIVQCVCVCVCVYVCVFAFSSVTLPHTLILVLNLDSFIHNMDNEKTPKCSLGDCYTKSYVGLNPTCLPLLTMETGDSFTALSQFEIQIWKQPYGIQTDDSPSQLADARRKIKTSIIKLLTLIQWSCEHPI